MTLAEFASLCVAPFPGSASRPALFAELERLVSDLDAAGIPCELWVDGSFLTEKPDPADIDLTVVVHVEAMDALPQHVADDLINTFNGGKRYSPALDTFIAVQFRKEDPRSRADRSSYWSGWWSRGRDESLKGYAVIKLGETDVGLRLFA